MVALLKISDKFVNGQRRFHSFKILVLWNKFVRCLLDLPSDVDEIIQRRL